MLPNEHLDRILRERDSHTKQNDILAESYRLKDRFKHIWIYPSRRRYDRTLLKFLKTLGGKKVLDYGCGKGNLSQYILSQGGSVYGIDISLDYIKNATDRCISEGYDTSRFHFYQMDAHDLDFQDNTFDIIVGLGILHHLNTEMALPEIYRVLKPGGRVLLQEPLADNPLLRIFRRLTPSARTVDEKPFTKKDIERLKGSSEWVSEMSFCGLIEAPIAMVTSVLLPDKVDNLFLRAADWLECKFHRLGFLDSWNQYVLINLVKQPIV